MNVFLIGFMGVGKSTIGKKLAKRLNLHFIDLDQRIEEVENQTISEIFEKQGENYFRVTEAQTLKNIHSDQSLIAVGGGTPCYKDSLSFMKENGVVIYLYADTQLIISRLLNSKTKRPLIEAKKDNAVELESYVKEILAERKSFYEKAHFSFNTTNVNAKKLDELAEKIKSLEIS